jgi:hypothetical protein
MNKLKTIKENLIFQNKFITLYNNEVGNNENKTFNHIKLIDGSSEDSGVVIICEIENTNSLLLLESYRYGIDDFIIEMPRGYIEKDKENFKEATFREISEEINLNEEDILDFKYIGNYKQNPSIMNSTIHVTYLLIKNDLSKLILSKEENITNIVICKKEEIINTINDGLSLSSYLLYKEHINKIENKINDILRNTPLSYRNDVANNNYLTNSSISGHKKLAIQNVLNNK